MKFHQFSPLWLLLVLALLSLACNLVNNLPRLGEVQSTAKAVATEVQQGRDLLGTARVFATEIGGAGFLQTAQVFATQAGESGLLETAQAFATESGPGLIETARAFATEAGPGLVDTAQAALTQAASLSGQVPEDIPLVSGDKTNFIANETLISYQTTLPLNDVVGFYLNQMPVNGWEAREQGRIVTDAVAVLPFSKLDRDALVTISQTDGMSLVLINITPR